MKEQALHPAPGLGRLVEGAGPAPTCDVLQSLVEAAAWLLRITEDFRYSVIVLRETKGVRYANFLEPGRQMTISVELTKKDENLGQFKGKGEVEAVSVVSARFTLGGYNLSEREPALRSTDERMVNHLRSLYTLLKGDLGPNRS